MRVPTDRIADFVAHAEGIVRRATETPGGAAVLAELDAHWPLHLERGAQATFFQRDPSIAELTRTFDTWPEKTPLLPGQLALVGGLLVRVLYQPQLDLEEVTWESPDPHYRFTFQLFDRGGLVPAGVADLPDWLFEGGMPAEFNPDTGVAHRGVFRAVLQPLFPLRFYRAPIKAQDVRDPLYISKLRELGFQDFSAALTKPQVELMLRYPTYEEFEAAHDEWTPAAGKKAEQLLYTYRSEFRDRAPVGVFRQTKDGSILFLAKAPSDTLAERRAEAQQRKQAAEETSAAADRELLARQSEVLWSNTLPAELRKVHDLRFLPDTTVEVTRGERLVVRVHWADAPGLAHKPDEVYGAAIRHAPYYRDLDEEGREEWERWQFSARLLDAVSRLESGAIVKEAAALALFIPPSSTLLAQRVGANDGEEALIAGHAYAFGRAGAGGASKPGFILYRLPGAAQHLLHGAEQPANYYDDKPQPTVHDAIVEWIRNHRHLASGTTGGPEYTAAAKAVAAEVAATTAQAERIRREGAPGWARYRGWPEFGGLGTDAKLRERLWKGFQKDYAKMAAIIPIAGERWVMGRREDPSEGPVYETGTTRRAAEGIAFREPAAPGPAPNFDPIPRWTEFLAPFEDTRSAEVVPTQTTLGAKTLDWLQKLADVCSPQHDIVGGSWSLAQGVSERAPANLQPPAGFLLSTDGHRAHLAPLSVAPAKPFAVPCVVATGGGPIRPVTHEAGLSPYFAWKAEPSMPAGQWVDVIPKPRVWGSVSQQTLKAWASARNPLKRGAELGGRTIVKVAAAPLHHLGADFGTTGGTSRVQIHWSADVQAPTGNEEVRHSVDLPGIDWDDPDDRDIQVFRLNPLYMREAAELLILSKARVRVAFTHNLAPVVFWQVEPVSQDSRSSEVRLVQAHILMPMRMD